LLGRAPDNSLTDHLQYAVCAGAEQIGDDAGESDVRFLQERSIRWRDPHLAPFAFLVKPSCLKYSTPRASVPQPRTPPLRHGDVCPQERYLPAETPVSNSVRPRKSFMLSRSTCWSKGTKQGIGWPSGIRTAYAPSRWRSDTPEDECETRTTRLRAEVLQTSSPSHRFPANSRPSSDLRSQRTVSPSRFENI
jgi:hypothetical protein